MKYVLLTSAWLLFWFGLALAMSGCSLEVKPDGSRKYSFDAEQAARAIVIYGSK